VQGTYETFVEAGRQHYNGNLTGKWILTAGLGGMGGAQPLAAVMAGACCLAVECHETRIDFRLKSRYVDAASQRPRRRSGAIDEVRPRAKRSPSALLGNAAEIFPELVKPAAAPGHRHRPDLRP
jgi:urocanate hydratase